jgi:glucokinase
MKARSIDLEGTHTNRAIVENRKIICSHIMATNSATALALLLRFIAKTLKGLVERESMPLDDFTGLAVGFCGLVNRAERKVISTNTKYQDAPILDWRTWAHEQFNLTLHLENYSRMAHLGEWYADAATGFDDVVMVTLGTRIGGAVMIGGQLQIGKHFQAGCLAGHLLVRVGGEKCTCGSIGCAESEAAACSLPDLCHTWTDFGSSSLAHEELNFESLFRRADAGDAVATDVRDYCLKVWAKNAVALIHAY